MSFQLRFNDHADFCHRLTLSYIFIGLSNECTCCQGSKYSWCLLPCQPGLYANHRIFIIVFCCCRFTALFTFPQERKMLLKERASGMYRLSAFYFARLASDLPM